MNYFININSEINNHTKSQFSSVSLISSFQYRYYIGVSIIGKSKCETSTLSEENGELTFTNARPLIVFRNKAATIDAT